MRIRNCLLTRRNLQEKKKVTCYNKTRFFKRSTERYKIVETKRMANFKKHLGIKMLLNVLHIEKFLQKGSFGCLIGKERVNTVTRVVKFSKFFHDEI